MKLLKAALRAIFGPPVNYRDAVKGLPAHEIPPNWDQNIGRADHHWAIDDPLARL